MLRVVSFLENKGAFFQARGLRADCKMAPAVSELSRRLVPCSGRAGTSAMRGVPVLVPCMCGWI